MCFRIFTILKLHQPDFGHEYKNATGNFVTFASENTETNQHLLLKHHYLINLRDCLHLMSLKKCDQCDNERGMSHQMLITEQAFCAFTHCVFLLFQALGMQVLLRIFLFVLFYNTDYFKYISYCSRYVFFENICIVHWSEEMESAVNFTTRISVKCTEISMYWLNVIWAIFFFSIFWEDVKSFHHFHHSFHH